MPPDGGAADEVSFYLHQRYFGGSMLLPSGLVVRSVLVVRTGADGRITALEERWNGRELIGLSAFRWVRRRRCRGLLGCCGRTVPTPSARDA